MKSQIYVLTIFCLLSNGFAQPKFSLDIGFGFYEPTLTGFDDNVIDFPKKSIINRNLLMNIGIYYEFFYNARIGYHSFISLDAKNNVTLDSGGSTANFRRSINYHCFPLETFFRWRPRIELNFTLTPIWGRSIITLETASDDQLEDWDNLISSFGGIIPIAKLESSESMINNWLGYGSMLGVRYYLTSRMAIDIKSGFMNHYYNEKSWKLKGRKVTGPKMKIDDLPIFSIKFIYSIR